MAESQGKPDYAAMVESVDESVGRVMRALRDLKLDNDTLVLSVADHETGGLTLGRDGIYDVNVDFLRRAAASGEVIKQRIDAGEDPRLVLAELAGIDSLTAEQEASLEAAASDLFGPGVVGTLLQIMSEHALVGWTTSGHTGVDIGLHAYGDGANRFRGTLDIDEVGRRVSDLLRFDLATMTEALRERTAAAPVPATGE